MNEFKTCNICSGFDGDLLKDKLEKLDPSASIDVKCQSMCAIGSKGPFVIVNGIPVMDNTVDGLILKVENMIKK